MNRWLAGCLLLVIGGAGLWYMLPRESTLQQVPQNELAAFLSSGSTDGYARVVPGYRFSFPRDHGAHNDFRQEWWYLTGNLTDTTGNEFGYQLTFFRFAHARSGSPDSSWSYGQTWMAHFALSDISAGNFYQAEDVSRQSIGLAGADPKRFHVWLNNWSINQQETDCAHCLKLTANAKMPGFSIELDMKSHSSPVLQGAAGYSQKSHSADVASYYYSLPHLETTGDLTIGDVTIPVSGLSWMDREWSSAVLGKTQSGWDWFSFHLDDGRKLMVFQVRDDVNGDFRHGVLMDTDFAVSALQDLQMIPGEWWHSPATGKRYPLQWTLQFRHGDKDASLVVESRIDNQEMALSFAYYEGVTLLQGDIGGKPIRGRGYMELTGYE